MAPTPAAVAPPPPPPPPPAADTIVKHIHFVNEKRDVGLQLSRSDLPSSSNHSKSAQTRWTSTKTDRSEYHHSKSRYLRTIEDPSLDDLSTASYRPPPLYFNSHSDFLQMMTPATTNYAEEAKENRLSYLASIPIEEITNDHSSDEDENHLRQQGKAKSSHNVRFNLPSASTNVPRAKTMPKQQLLANDFLQNFPLLRSLVEEALALQNQQNGSSIPLPDMIFSDRPRSAAQQGQRKSQPSPPRPRSMRTKSVIIARKPTTNSRRLYPPPPQTRQMVVTKNEVRSLVDRLSKPKFNKRIEREIAVAGQMIALPEPPVTPRLPPRPTSAPVRSSFDLTSKGFFYSFLFSDHECQQKYHRPQTTPFLRDNTCTPIVRRIRSCSSCRPRTSSGHVTEIAEISTKRITVERSPSSIVTSINQYGHSLALFTAEQSGHGYCHNGEK